MFLKFTTKLLSFLILAIVAYPFLTLNAQNTVTTLGNTTNTISIVNPGQGQVIVARSLVFSGTAPAGVIITFTIQDEDFERAFQVHQENLIINASTTSDRNGDWVYSPVTNLVPGRYSIVAGFQNSNQGTISTEKVFFTVADDSGATSWFTVPGSTLLIIIVILIASLLFVIYRVTKTKKRRFVLHTTMGDIPVQEIIKDDNNVEIVPIIEPIINLGSPMVVGQPAVLQPNVMIQQPMTQMIYPQQQVAAMQQPMAMQIPQQVIYQQPVIQQRPIQLGRVATTNQGIENPKIEEGVKQ